MFEKKQQSYQLLHMQVQLQKFAQYWPYCLYSHLHLKLHNDHE